MGTVGTKKFGMGRGRLGWLLAASAAFAGSAASQTLQMEGPASVTQPQQIGMSWTDGQFGEIASMLIGSWKTTEPVPLAPGAEGEPAAVTMHIAPVQIAGMPDTLYVEVSREDGLHEPYYQAVFQLYNSADGPRLRTYEFRAPEGLNPALHGLWAAADRFPELGRSDLVARIDMDLAATGDGYVGKTPYPYPTARGGAMEMTSELQLRDGSIRTRDQGLDAMGNIVWGSGDDASFEFERFQPDVTVRRFNDGLLAISYGGGEGDATIGEGDRVVLDYSGYLATGVSFDSSFKPGGRPLDYVTPGRLIPGWQSVIAGAKKGERRRLVIPPQFGYGERGNPRAGISGTDTLFFDIAVIGLEASEPVSQGEAPAGPNMSGNVRQLDATTRQSTGVSPTGEIRRTQPAPNQDIPSPQRNTDPQQN